MKTSRAAPYKDASLPIEQRVDDLIARMTLDEKVYQMAGAAVVEWIKTPTDVVLLKKGRFQKRNAKRLIAKCIGALSELVRYMEPDEGARTVNELQRFALRKTRLGIPIFVFDEALHGCCAKRCTSFPQAIGWASTWDTDLALRMGLAMGKEARDRGINQVLSPILDVSHDPRWGRTEETLGEDPYLVGKLGVAVVRGLQQRGVAATLKHFGVHNAPEGGLNIAPTTASERMARDVYLRPFEMVVREAKPLSVMSAYSEWDGVPASANRWMMTELLRGEWGFDGHVVSDYGSITMLADRHAIAVDEADAGRQAVDAGVDLELPILRCYRDLVETVRSGRFPQGRIDAAVRRILRSKFRLGLFEDPYAAAKQTIPPAHRKLAREAANKSIVLLENRAKLLPIRDRTRSIAVIGPNADTPRIGNYGPAGVRVVTALEGIRKKAPKGTTVRYAKGCEIYGAPDDRAFAKAVDLAKNADLAVVVLGEVSDWGAKDPNPVCGEGYDSDSLTLGGRQLELVKAVHAVQKNVVVVLYNGRPLAVPWIQKNVSAVLEAWYPGEEGGTALADILFGHVNPSGRLPITIPATVGQLPVYYNHKPTARGFNGQPGTPDKSGRDYVFASPKPLWPFGHGLSYTVFRYSGLKATPARSHVHGRFTVSVDVRNAGKRDGEEVVQLYVRDCVASVTRPVKELRGFQRVALRRGEKKRVTFELGYDDLAFCGRDMSRTVEPGKFWIMVGGSSEHAVQTEIEIVGAEDTTGGRATLLTTEEMGWH
jgi:beta-glucosidase